MPRSRQGPRSRGGLSRFSVLNGLEIAEQELAKGLASENLVEKALQILAQRGEIFNYYRCERDGENDQLGWDFLVMPEADWMIGLQVKSSVIGKEAHVNKFGLRIACVIVKEFVYIETLCQEILEALGLSTKSLKQVLQKEQRLFNPLGRALKSVLPAQQEDLDDQSKSNT